MWKRANRSREQLYKRSGEKNDALVQMMCVDAYEQRADVYGWRQMVVAQTSVPSTEINEEFDQQKFLQKRKVLQQY